VQINSNILLKNPARSGIFYFRLLLLAAGLLAGLTAIAQPQLSITDAKKNFGFVQRGTVVKNEYEITNTGNQPLLITGVEIACSCTSVDYPKEPVLPGRKTVIVVSFNTTTVYGRQDRVVLINSNDPKGPYRLRYKGTVSRNKPTTGT
jgi:hypothetical protein